MADRPREGGTIDGWTARALVFSGRPDPSWPVCPAQAERLVALCEGPPADGPRERCRPPLGYRGLVLCSPRGETWTAWDNRVIGPDGTVRADPDRRVERALAATAPEGLLPVLPGMP